MPETVAPPQAPFAEPRWRMSDLDLDAIDRSQVAEDPFVFRTVFLASLVETGADLYSRNLVEYFAGDDELGGWLATSWEPEEVQHGRALRAYVERAWPEVDWQHTYEEFFASYSRTCTLEDLEPTQALELAARCMVETGTATLYGALHRYAREPVLKDLAGRIYADEVRHYKYFYRHFRRYQARAHHPRHQVARVLFSRLVETRTGDGYHAFRALMGNDACDEAMVDARYREFTREFSGFVLRNAPAGLSVRMGLKPLDLPPSIEGWITRHAAPIYRLWVGGAPTAPAQA